MPSDTVRIDREKVLAFVTESGGKDSHAAILARASGVPAVVGVEGLLSKITKGDTLVVDGDMGIVVINPPLEVFRTYEELRQKRRLAQSELEKLVPVPSRTIDGREVRLWANVSSLVDLEYALHFGAHGVGLFRTELPFLVWGYHLSEEEQYALYRSFVSQADGKVVTIRTLDLGGDKLLGAGKETAEKNPFLGYRGIRRFLEEGDIARRQLRAILRSSVNGGVRILFPMISCIEEVRRVKRLLAAVKAELRSEGLGFDERVPVGVMIEVPSMAILADRLVREVDFLSIGTNDLIQYTVAADRDNERVNSLYQPLHPAVLRLIQNVTDAATRAGKPVACCGEMAGDVRYVPLLVGMGLTDLSMNPSALLEVKQRVRAISAEKVQALAQKALQLSTAAGVARLVERV